MPHCAACLAHVQTHPNIHKRPPDRLPAPLCPPPSVLLLRGPISPTGCSRKVTMLSCYQLRRQHMWFHRSSILTFKPFSPLDDRFGKRKKKAYRPSVTVGIFLLDIMRSMSTATSFYGLLRRQWRRLSTLAFCDPGGMSSSPILLWSGV
jgi:hypothetical protein